MTTLPLSALQDHAAPGVSRKYAFMGSTEVVRYLAEEGWTAHSARSSAPRKRDPLFAKHLIEFRRADGDLRAFPDKAEPRLLFTNAHDGSAAASMRAGLYRYVCSNGLVIGTDVGRASVRHLGDAGERATELIERVRLLSAATVRSGETVERWQGIQLSATMRRDFARMASVLRWGDAERFAPEALLGVRRAEDDKGDLWHVFNRIQENAVRGGLRGLNASGHNATSVPLTGIDRDLSFNERLWKLAEEVAEVA